MSSIKEKIIENLVTINTFRSSSYIADKLKIQSDTIKQILKGDFKEIGMTLEGLTELISTTFEEELAVGKSENAILKFKANIINRIIELEDSLGIEEARNILGKTSVTVYKKYKNGDIANSQLFYVFDMLNRIEKDTHQVKVADSSIEKETKPNIKAIKTIVEENVSVSGNKESHKEPIEVSDGVESVSKEEQTCSSRTVELNEISSKGEISTMNNKKQGMTSIVFKNIEEAIKTTFGDGVNIRQVIIDNDKIVIEACIEEQENN